MLMLSTLHCWIFARKINHYSEQWGSKAFYQELAKHYTKQRIVRYLQLCNESEIICISLQLWVSDYSFTTFGLKPISYTCLLILTRCTLSTAGKFCIEVFESVAELCKMRKLKPYRKKLLTVMQKLGAQFFFHGWCILTLSSSNTQFNY